MKTKKLIKEILIQLNGKTFDSNEQVNEFFKRKLDIVAKNAYSEGLKDEAINCNKHCQTNNK